MDSSHKQPKKEKIEYLINAVLFHIVLIIIIYFSSNKGIDETRYNVLIRSFIFGAIISYPIFFLEYYREKIYIPKKSRNMLHHEIFQPLLQNAFVINDENMCLEGKVDDYFVRIFGQFKPDSSKRYTGQIYEIFIDMYFLEDIRSRAEVKSIQGFFWYVGFIRSVLKTTKKNLPSSEQIETECKLMTEILKANSFSPVPIERWEDIYLPDYKRFKEEQEKAKIKKEFKFLGMDIKILKGHKNNK